jgi:hypothetical protein
VFELGPEIVVSANARKTLQGEEYCGKPEHYFFTVDGSSMQSRILWYPEIKEGDILWYEDSDMCEPGDEPLSLLNSAQGETPLDAILADLEEILRGTH